MDMKVLRWIILSLFIIFLGILTPQAHAFTAESGDLVDLSRDQTINGSLFVGANTVLIDGTVHGDLFCAGQKVTITGTIDGDVICGGQTIEITGAVGGNIRAAAQSLTIGSSVKRNVSVAGATIELSKTASVAGELLFAGQTLIDDGVIKGGITGVSEGATVNGPVAGDISLDSDTVTLGASARIRGNVTYTSDTKATIASSASISGAITQQKPQETTTKTAPTQNASAQWPANAIPGILFYLIVTFVILKLFPASTTRITDRMTASIVPTALTGLITLVVVPLVTIVLAVTIVGIPFALVLALLYVVAILVCRVYVGILVGWYILDSFHSKLVKSVYWQMLIGVPILWFMFKAPFVGGLVGFLAVIWGLGAIVHTFRKPHEDK